MLLAVQGDLCGPARAVWQDGSLGGYGQGTRLPGTGVLTRDGIGVDCWRVTGGKRLLGGFVDPGAHLGSVGRFDAEDFGKDVSEGTLGIIEPDAVLGAPGAGE